MIKGKLVKFVLALCVPIFSFMTCERPTGNINRTDTGNTTFDTNQTAKTPCPEDVICTQMLVMVTVKVTDNSGQPVILDSAYTMRTGSSERITFQQARQTGIYTILDDFYVKKLQQQQAAFTFIGMKNGREVINESYTISADCCHIKKESGKSEIILP